MVLQGLNTDHAYPNMAAESGPATLVLDNGGISLKIGLGTDTEPTCVPNCITRYGKGFYFYFIFLFANEIIVAMQCGF